MSCGHYLAQDGCDDAFTVDASRITFGRGCLDEVGNRARAHGMKRVALFTDACVREIASYASVHDSLAKAGIDVIEFSEVQIEPDDASFAKAIRFAAENKLNGYVSIGG